MYVTPPFQIQFPGHWNWNGVVEIIPEYCTWTNRCIALSSIPIPWSMYMRTCACVYVYNICTHTAVLQFVCVCACECVCFMFTHATRGMRRKDMWLQQFVLVRVYMCIIYACTHNAFLCRSMWVCTYVRTRQYCNLCVCVHVNVYVSCSRMPHEGWKGRICQLQQFSLSLKFTPHTFHTLSGHENTCPQWAGEVEGEESRRAYSCDGGELIVPVAVWLVMSSKDCPTLSICLRLVWSHVYTSAH